MWMKCFILVVCLSFSLDDDLRRSFLLHSISATMRCKKSKYFSKLMYGTEVKAFYNFYQYFINNGVERNFNGYPSYSVRIVPIIEFIIMDGGMFHFS